MIKMKVIDGKLFEQGLPATATPGSAGYDLRASLDEPLYLQPDTSYKVPVGIAIDIGDRNIGAFVFPRSGLAAKYNITLQNGVGVIDSDYQGEISILLRNEGTEVYKVNPGDRVAQLVFMPVMHPVIGIVTEFDDETQRGDGGFGHTGVSTKSDSEANAPEIPVLVDGCAAPAEINIPDE